jgi:hypothetical protein
MSNKGWSTLVGLSLNSLRGQCVIIALLNLCEMLLCRDHVVSSLDTSLPHIAKIKPHLGKHSSFRYLLEEKSIMVIMNVLQIKRYNL